MHVNEWYAEQTNDGTRKNYMWIKNERGEVQCRLLSSPEVPVLNAELGHDVFYV